MSTRLRSSIVAALAALTGACAAVNIPTATPRDQLPALMVPAELVAQAGVKPQPGAGSTYVAVDERAQSRPDADVREPVATPTSAGGAALIAAAPQPASYALVIGIEKYRDVAAATGARRDAESFAELTRQTLGVPEDHVRLLLDDRATKTDIAKQVRWLQTNVTAGGRVYVYFSGHGAPDPATGVSYIVPYDGDPQYLTESAIKMSDILDDLEKTKAKDVLAIADSCFSGAGGRSVLAPGTRPLVHVERVKSVARVALFSASSGAEISGPTADGTGGLFSRYLIEALGSGAADINGDGQISLAELDEWIRPRVKRDAKRANRDQTPSLQVGKKLGEPGEFIVAWGYGK